MLGIIGDNGSGKSTLLKLLAGITFPSEGDIKTYGKVAAMLELGVGFHPELSGMENIFLNGTVLGMSHKEISAKMRRIIEFSGLGEFIYTPVKHYSSGMFARLGFSIAIHSEPDILLVDEILAVGDAGFQMRCLEEIKRLRALGTTVVLISHNISLIEMLSDKVFWLDKGSLRAEGSPSQICHLYRQTIERREVKPLQGAHPYFQAVAKPHTFCSQGILVSAEITDVDGTPKSIFTTGEPMKILIQYNSSQPLKNPCLSVLFRYVEREIPVAEISTEKQPDISLRELKGRGKFIIETDALILLAGKYELSLVLYNALDSSEIYDTLLSFQTIEVKTVGEYLPVYLIIKPPCRWEHIPEE